ncbi:MAG: UDP-N-acetylmuramate--L-alanine ligase [Synergistaceae bacterium]|nr:UDP-N-acetylmuramate--L-alanine ligase [Synergistaceae bacterium]
MEVNEAFAEIKTPMKIHLMGIGGAGMSGLAILLSSMGHIVSGCDMEDSFYLKKVRQAGVQVTMGHHREHIDAYSPSLIIHTSAIPQDHPELIDARKRGIKVARRAEILSLIFNSRKGVGIAGTHGKTTTSSMISLIAERAELMPTVAIGGELSDIGCNAKLGNGEFMVAELDESDGSFELFAPEVAIITNIDWDHIDHYPSYGAVIDAFSRFADGKKPGAPLIICAEDPGAQRMLSFGNHPDAITYGWGSGWSWGAGGVRHNAGGGVDYTVFKGGTAIGTVKLKVSGEHNVLNSLAALAAADLMGIPFEPAAAALETFGGAKRRLQFVGEFDDILIYDDYGHHPSEILATMSAISKAWPDRSLSVVFQPHRYTRTEALYRDFARALKTASRVYLLPIYPADESPISGVSSFLIMDELTSLGFGDAVMCGDFKEAADLVCDNAENGDLVLTLGAGSIETLGRQIMSRLQEKRGHGAECSDEKAIVA